MKKKQTLADFKLKREYKLWERLREMSRNLEITSDGFYTSKDNGGVYWEPFLVLLFKLGNIIKQTGKLKEIKMDWMRPLNYFESQTDGKIIYDGKTYVVDKHGTTNANNLRTAFRSVLTALEGFDELSDTNFQSKYKTLHTESGGFFKYLSVFVKDGFRLMHENIKEILKPLRMVRKPAYQLFSLEKKENNIEDLTLFQSKKQMGVFTKNINAFIKSEEYKLKKDADIDKLDDVLGNALSQNYYEYHYTEKIRENELETEADNVEVEKPPQQKLTHEEQKKIKEDEILYELTFLNIQELKQQQPTTIHKEAIQMKFEEGLDAMFKYLQLKLVKNFPFDIEAHKIFVNLNKIPFGHSTEQVEFFLAQLTSAIEELKQKCYDMKINGLSRVLIPITKNEAFVSVLKKIYDMHNIIDRILGDKLLYDQYMFIYEAVRVLLDSTVREDFEVLKKKEFFEDSIPKYVLYESMRRSVEVMRKMIKQSRSEGKYFNKDDYYQFNKHILDGENNIVIYAYELNDTLKRTINDEMRESMKIYDNELFKYGRFWLMEGYFPPEDRELWLEAIEILHNINDLVQEDIRDTLLIEHKDKIPIETSDSDRKTSSKLNPLMKKKTTLKGSSKKGFNKVGKETLRRRRSRIPSFSEEDEFLRKIPSKFDGLRPPFVWNFPVNHLRNLKNQELLKEGHEPLKTEIRNVDPRKCYKDKRVEKFTEKFNLIFHTAMEYSLQHKGNQWVYVFDKVLKELKISYDFPGLKKIEGIEKEEEEPILD